MNRLAMVVLSAGMALVGLSAASPAADAPSTDWPQLRGTARDGVVSAGPRLADVFPETGPKLLWKTTYGLPMLMAQNGGSCSPVVAGGKLVLYVNSRPFVRKKLITADYLAKWGWNADMPADLAKAVEIERQKHEYDKSLYGKDADPHAMETLVKTFLGKVEPASAEKFKATIEKRLGFQYTVAWDWDTLAAMHRNMDTEFKSRTEFEVLYQTAPMHHNGILGAEVEMFMKQLEQSSLDIVICLDASTGKEIWKKEFAGLSGRSGTMNSWPASGTPTIVGDKIYLTASAAVYCLSLQTGEPVWKSKPLTRCENSSPLVVNGKACVVLEQGLTCFDANSGEQLWKNNAMGGRWDWGCTAAQWSKDGITYIIGGNGKCVALDSGKTVWSAPHVTDSCVAPTIAGDTAIFFGAKLQAYSLAPDKAEQLWSIAGKSGDRVSGPIVYQDNVYTTAMGGTRCIDLKTGEVRWEDEKHRTMFTMPVLADGKIFAASDDDAYHGHDTYWPTLFCYKPSAGKFELAWKMPADSALAYCSSPAIANGRLYLHQLDCIACYDLAR